MKRIILAFALASIIGCGERDRPLIYAKSGLVDFSQGTANIYQYQNTFDYAENSTCNVGGINIGCMRFGFELEWDFEDPRTILQCKTHISLPVRKQTKEGGELKEAITTSDFEIVLDGKKGKYVYPRSYYNFGSRIERSTKFTTRCYKGDVLAFSLEQEIHERPN